MTMRTAWIVFCAGLAGTGLAQPPSMAVVEKKAGAVGFYTAAGKRVAGVKVGERPHEIVTSPDGRYAYVSDNGILWMTDKGEGGNTISIVDLQERRKTGVIDLGANRRPHGMDVDARGRLVVTTENPDGLLLVDPVAKKVLRRFDVKGKAPHMVLLDSKGEWAYVSNTNSNDVAAVNLASGEVKLIPIDAYPQGGTRSADGKLIYITSRDGNSISIIDTARRERVGRIATGKGPARVALTPDGKTLVYNLQPSQGVAFADVATRKETGVVALPGIPLSLTLAKDGATAYLGLQDSDKIAVVSVAQRKVIQVIDTPKEAGPDPVLPLR